MGEQNKFSVSIVFTPQLERFSHDLENAQTKQKQQKNGNRGIWLVYQTDTNARGFWLVKQMLEWKNFIAMNFLEINRITSLWHHTATRCNTIG